MCLCKMSSLGLVVEAIPNMENLGIIWTQKCSLQPGTQESLAVQTLTKRKDEYPAFVPSTEYRRVFSAFFTKEKLGKLDWNQTWSAKYILVLSVYCGFCLIEETKILKTSVILLGQAP